MRALLIVNQTATTTSELSQDVLIRALGSEVDLDIAYTRERGHGAKLAGDAAASGCDVVVTLGGDGTVNEVVNGLLAEARPVLTARGLRGHADRLPALAVVPGGSTNVFARSLGLPRDWGEGTGVILEALREGRTRSISLGMADDRYFTFCAGLGLDAEVVGRVERARRRGRTSSPMLYLSAMAGQFFAEANRMRPQATLSRPDDLPIGGVTTVIVQNTSPWTYLGDRAIDACPSASFATRLDLMALRGLHLPSTSRTVWQMLSGGGTGADHVTAAGPHGRRVLRLHDLPGFSLRANRPMAFQLDGDYLGERDEVMFRSVENAVRVVV
jgi:diacylglycerol kinase family enzyme